MSAKAQLYINSTEHQSQSAKRKHFWRSCISTAIKSLRRCRSGRHSPVDRSGLSTAISSKKYIWCRCMSPARYSCMSTAIKYLKRNRSGRHSLVNQRAAVHRQRGTLTTISKAEAYLAQMYISSNRELKAMPFRTTQPCRSERYINRDQQQETYLAQMCVTSAV